MRDFFSNFFSGDRRWLKLLILALIAVIIIFIVVTIIVVVSNRGDGTGVAPRNMQDILNKRFGQEQGIALVDFNPLLTIDKAGNIKMVKATDLKPITEDLMKKGKQEVKEDKWLESDSLLYDDQIVGTIIKYNSDLVSYINPDKSGKVSQKVFDSVKKGSPAEEFTKTIAKKSRIAYHALVFGAIVKGSGKNYYALVQEHYTIINIDTSKGTEQKINYVYKLTRNGDKMVIEDIEKVGEEKAMPLPEAKVTPAKSAADEQTTGQAAA